MVFIDKNHDLDSSEDVWNKLYKIVYKKDFQTIFDFENLEDKETSKSCKRYYIKINKKTNPKLQKDFPKFKIAGDCDFNFNDKKVKMFKNILNEENYELLEYCHRNHHELWNFSFMPITGGLNNTKGTMKNLEEMKSFDRLDLFIYELNLYYNGKENRIFDKCTKECRNALIWYLSQFQDIYEYCKKIYFIDDKKFVDEFISLGAEPINQQNPKNAIKYMELAKKYWDYKKEKLKGLVVKL